ncbi:NADH-quinone oxidoreductase subunit NuoG [Oleiagrimonas sp.]|jgi:NADH-quinone oxidoreductase subunit G|uniref:NADH-quinone oxidoreductase subunit NuoG n=1 Tax=Oleiagrimonas sp. TaxID=2010330 RepID=UPI0026071DC7|nr:NADH-quinone oxidoreductase subunit NuoG [Oleiagrimonas sp.]MDA3913715.1 NADH-quinone oxidoreductase subunit NuoG [Oleiagrimonas sp.]
MSAQPKDNTAPDLVNIEIDGKAMQAPKGSTIIQAADKAGISIPRFCYHPKLAIAANCRQCLVEVEMNGKPVPKPQPACSTPVGEGMKVATRSEKAMHWQRNVMEFLLINHPLDCPICDQGGECELQDIALGYGRSVSRFTERKRSVADENLGSLVATEMTRCIQCTRCVRFMGEIAGTYELGSMNRGEHLEIGTYIGKSIQSEIGGNIIDVCPVGALTNKPFRFKARAWELLARPSIGYHDALGSNLWLHTRRGEVLRTVPRDNESVNECWLSDRDRYSHEGLVAEDRLSFPMIKINGVWKQTDWDDALANAADALHEAGADIGVLVHPSTSNEEGELLRRLASGLGTPHLDHRLRQQDFSDMPVARVFETPVDRMDGVAAALLVGSHLRHEMPLLGQRLRQAVHKGAKVYAVGSLGLDQGYALAGETLVSPQHMVAAVLGIAKLAAGQGSEMPKAMADALADVQPDAAAQAAFEALKQAGDSVVVFGEMAAMHPQASWLRAASRLIAKATQSGYNEIPLGANAVGLARAGVLPQHEGLDARSMLEQPRSVYVLYGAEPPHDFADGKAVIKALHEASTVVACTAFASEALRETADILLPLALLPETDATLTNVDGLEQRLAAGATVPGQARPGWRMLRALGGRLELPGFEFDDLQGLEQQIHEAKPPVSNGLADPGPAQQGFTRIASLPIYRLDAVLRRAKALNAHPLTLGAAVHINASEAGRLGVKDGARVRVADSRELTVRVNDAVPVGATWIESAYAETAMLPPYGAAITLTKA